MNSIQQQKDDTFWLSNEAFSDCIGPDSFNPKLLEEAGVVRSEAPGRGSAWFIDVCDQACVLRHYFRGGLVGRLTKDRFIWNGLKRTRAWLEWELLAFMREEGLPVPMPMGAAVHRDGLFYTCDILTQEIPSTRTLADFLANQDLDTSVWESIGHTIAQFHSHNIWHSDLNARNILLDEGQSVFLIDFDKSGVRKDSESWKSANLDRLLRSLRKFSDRDKAFHFGDDDWQSLLQGYKSFESR